MTGESNIALLFSIDVLGDSRKFLNVVKLPFVQDRQENNMLILHDTASYVMPLRKGFRNFLEARNKSTSIVFIISR